VHIRTGGKLHASDGILRHHDQAAQDKSSCADRQAIFCVLALLRWKFAAVRTSW
jgi:hypothetical protein